MDPIGVGIIGTGFWGRKLAAEYLDAEHRGRVKLIKVCDNSIAALGALLIDYETTSICEERLTLEIRDVLDNPEISAVHIATSSETHNAFARMALEAGKNVLVEKPMALSSSAFHQLVDVAAEKGLVIDDAHGCQFNRAIEAARDMLRRRDIGRVSYVSVQWADPSDLVDGDIIFDLGPEPFDILNLVLGTWPREVSGVAGAYRNSRYDEIVHIFAEYPDEVSAHIELSRLHPRKVRELFVVGSQATLAVDCTNQRIIKRCGGISYEIPVIASNTIASEIDHFVDKILHGDLAADHTGSRTVETLEVVRSCLWRRAPRVARSESEKSPSHHEMPNLETAAGLLEIVHKGTNNTPVTSQDDLDPDLTQRYFMMLEKIGLVEGRSRANSEEKVYCITTKGLQFLTDFYESERLGEITDNTRRVLEAVGLGTG